MKQKRKTVINYCLFCKKSFLARAEKNKIQKYCNKKCVVASRTTHLIKSCAICNKEIIVKKVRVRDKNYCSIKHAHIGNRGKQAWNKGKGTKSRANELFRKSKEYALWRASVFKRDNYTCQWCYKKGGQLNADHIKPFSLFPEIRLAIDNGRTLCVYCHRKTDTYGYAYYNKYKKNQT